MGAELDRDVHTSEAVTGCTVIDVFVQFEAKPGCERALAGALRTVTVASREEPGCHSIRAFRAIRNTRVFQIHSVWEDEATFMRHGALPHTVAFLDQVARLLEHPAEPIRTRALE